MLYIKKETELSQEIIDVIDTSKAEFRKRLASGDSKASRKAFEDLRAKKILIKSSLLQEQHGLCAYCMKSIQGAARIEHWKPLSSNTEDTLEYANMFAVCDGGEKSEEPLEEWPQGRGKSGLCCDASKRDRLITLHPCDKEQMSKICYSDEDVFLYSNPRDEILEGDINVLHLNGVIRDGQFYCDTKTNLVYHRRQVYQSLKSYLGNLKEQIETPEEIVIAIKKKIMSIENAEKYPPFAGVLLYFLRRELKRYEGDGIINSSTL